MMTVPPPKSPRECGDADLPAQAMVVSVGGTPAPLVASILAHRPAFVSFLVSQQTVDDAVQAQAAAASQGCSFQRELTIVDDVNDLLHCYLQAEQAVQRVLQRGVDPAAVVVDYTGGTKNMSVAVALAAVSHAFGFSYVGGLARTKEGKGVVVDGAEQVHRGINPWDFLGLQERLTASLLFNRFQLQAARGVLDSLAARTARLQARFRPVSLAVAGYQRWDLYDYRGAIDFFDKARLPELAASDDRGIGAFAQATLALRPALAILSGCGRRPCAPLLADMYANAERRHAEGKYDDAVLRLYRLIEMAAQLRLLERYGIDSSDIRPEALPESLREEFRARHNAADGKIQAALGASYRLLAALGDDLGKVFSAREPHFRKLQSARNYSFLAHGFDTVKEATYAALRTFAVDIGAVNPEEARKCAFPALDL